MSLACRHAKKAAQGGWFHRSAQRKPVTLLLDGLFASAGELEADQFPFFHQLVAFFEQGRYPGVTLTTEIYAGEGHGSEGVALTFLHGLRMLLTQ